MLFCVLRLAPNIRAFFVFLGPSNESLSFGNMFHLFQRQPCLVEGVIETTLGEDTKDPTTHWDSERIGHED